VFKNHFVIGHVFCIQLLLSVSKELREPGIMDKQKLDALRQQAEEALGSAGSDFQGTSGDELRTALHELHIYQIELELQNDELHRLQVELMESRDQYIDLYDFAPVGYLTLNDKNLIEEANLTVANLLGEERKTLLGQHFTRYIVDEDQDTFFTCFRKLILATVKMLPCDLRIRRKNGNWFWAKLECVSRQKTDTSDFHIRIALHDNTEAKHLETEIFKAKKLEATAMLAGGIAHDFNNLLAVILGNLELVEEDILHGRPFAKKMLDAKEACRNAADLTKQFLTFSSGGEPVTESILIEPLIAYAKRLSHAESSVDFESSFPDGLWPVMVDPGQMAQAIGNVITNAKESQSEGGVIQMHAENVDALPGEGPKLPNDKGSKYVKFVIRDRGAGIPEDTLSRVFDPYFTSKNLYNKKGLGLGLTVSYSVIKKHGGIIDIVSKPGGGTTVSIFLPAGEEQVTPLQSEPRNGLPVSRKILVMDDEEMLRKVTKYMLESLGYEVEVACHGEEAIQLYSDAMQAGRPFGAAIIDLTINGGMGGRETIEKLIALDPDIRAIVASGYATDPVMANFRQYGFLDALPKPYQLQDLKKSLGGLVDGAEDR
jgi:PAS domain S-box-containing protein